MSKTGSMLEENYINGLELLIKDLLEKDTEPITVNESSVGKMVNDYINNEY